MKRISDFNNFNEGVKIASRAWQGGKGAHYDDFPNQRGRNEQLKKDALLHLFRDVVGKQMDFKMQTGKWEHSSLNYVLLKVTGKDEKTYSFDSKDYLQTFNFYFWAEEGRQYDFDPPFADNKQLVILQYSFKNDEFKQENGGPSPMMNRKLANFLVKAANQLREMVITADMPEKEITKPGHWYQAPAERRLGDERHFETDTEKAEELKKSKLKWSDFRCWVN